MAIDSLSSAEKATDGGRGGSCFNCCVRRCAPWAACAAPGPVPVARAGHFNFGSKARMIKSKDIVLTRPTTLELPQDRPHPVDSIFAFKVRGPGHNIRFAIDRVAPSLNKFRV